MSLLGRATSQRHKHKPQPINYDAYVGPVQSTRPLRGWAIEAIMNQSVDYRTYFLNRYDRLS